MSASAFHALKSAYAETTSVESSGTGVGPWFSVAEIEAIRGAVECALTERSGQPSSDLDRLERVVRKIDRPSKRNTRLNRKRVRTLERRCIFLQSLGPWGNSFDRAEAAALGWALAIVEAWIGCDASVAFDKAPHPSRAELNAHLLSA